MKLKDFRHKIDNIPLDLDDYEVTVLGIKEDITPNTVKCNYHDKKMMIYKYD